MTMLDHPITTGVISGLILAVILPACVWLFRKVFHSEIRIATAIEKGPTIRERGFTEPAVKITLANKSTKDILITDIRLIFCRHFGASVAPEAPPGRSHHQLPLSLPSGAEDHWFIPAQQLSSLLHSLYRPPNKVGTGPKTVRLYARCITGTNKFYRGPSFSFSTDPNSHWP